MMSFKKNFYIFFLALLILIVGVFFVSKTLAASQLVLDPASIGAVKDSDFDIKLLINTGSTPVFGSDATLLFSSSDLQVKSVSNGGFFTDFSYAQSSGRLEIHGFFSSLYETKSGSGTFANIKFTAKTNAGSSNLTFACDGSGNDTQLLDSSGINILSCSSLGQTVISFSGSGTSTSTPTGGSQQQGEPNSCGGTCGSNYNCKANLFCYGGYCRNPFCKSDTDCVCSSPTPTPKVTVTPKPLVFPTPEVIYLTKYSVPSPTPTEEAAIPEEVVGVSKTSKLNWTLIIEIAGGLFALMVIGLLINRARKRKVYSLSNLNQPIQNPPNNIDAPPLQ